MCAGITMWSPLVDWGCMKGTKMQVGIVGVGGLGTMGIKLAAAMGHDVIAFSRSMEKEEIAKKKGAKALCNTNDPASLAQYA